MNFVEGIVVDMLHTVIDDGPSENIADIGQCIKDFDAAIKNNESSAAPSGNAAGKRPVVVVRRAEADATARDGDSSKKNIVVREETYY